MSTTMQSTDHSKFDVIIHSNSEGFAKEPKCSRKSTRHVVVLSSPSAAVRPLAYGLKREDMAGSQKHFGARNYIVPDEWDGDICTFIPIAT